jgi:hypothetical protein
LVIPAPIDEIRVLMQKACLGQLHAFIGSNLIGSATQLEQHREITRDQRNS